MAKRLTTRLSAGAALVTGLSAFGIGVLATPAQAETTLVYTCQTAVGAKDLSVTIDTNAPETVAPGDTVTVDDISGDVEIPEDLANAMAGFLEWDWVTGTTPDVESAVMDASGATVHTVSTTLDTPKTRIFGPDGWEGGDTTPNLPLNGTGGTFTVADSASGEYTINAPESFSSTFTGTKRDNSDGGTQTVPCTYKSGDKVIDTITVSDETTPPTTTPPTTTPPTTDPTETDDPTTSEPTPEANDWFSEPSSLPITQDRKSFTVKGSATQAGTVNVVLLDGDKKVLRTTAWDVSEGANSRSFPFAEGTDYVRLVSEECVDSSGRTGDEPGGCNVEYYAPWVNPDTDDDNAGDDDSAGSPETPGVVQTDGFTRVEEPAGDNTAALLLGGTLLAGAGAGAVVLTRRRRSAQH